MNTLTPKYRCMYVSASCMCVCVCASVCVCLCVNHRCSCRRLFHSSAIEVQHKWSSRERRVVPRVGHDRHLLLLALPATLDLPLPRRAIDGELDLILGQRVLDTVLETHVQAAVIGKALGVCAGTVHGVNAQHPAAVPMTILRARACVCMRLRGPICMYVCMYVCMYMCVCM
jgi:hypothetical protein